MKAYFITLCYSNAAVFRSGAAEFRRTVDLDALGAQHILLHQHYPLHPTEVSAAISEYRAVTPRAIVWDAGCNLGLHDGLNYVVERLNQVLKPEDILIAFDMDEHPWSVGWVEALLRVFAADPKVGWLSLMSPPAKEHLDTNAVPTCIIGGEQVRIPNYPLINTLCAWRVEALRAVGGKFMEPYRYYGAIESHMMPMFTEAGYSVGWMVDYGVSPERELEDATYREYKNRHVGHKLPVFPGSFEEWVEHLYGT